MTSFTYPLRLFYDCSTAHLSLAARTYLERHASAQDEMIASTPHGWFVWRSSEPGDDVPADLVRVMAHARSVNAEYVLFDADGNEDPVLPTFDW